MDANSWTEFGISGMVIGALFSGLWYVMKNHREERKEWREDANSRQDKTDKVIKDLTKAIKDSWSQINPP